jgi:transcriptional regulator with XRE-family HTH domain
MANERLRKAMAAAHKSVQDVSDVTGVNEKTVQRWLSGRVPHARHRWGVANLLGEDERFLWPSADGKLEPGAATTAEVVATYAHRADVAANKWWDPMVNAHRQIDLLGYAMLFLPEAHPRLADLLRGKAAANCKIRILLGDPDSRQVAERDEEERLGGALISRIHNSLVHFGSLTDCEGVEIHLHTAPLYNSTFRFDDEMLVTPHLYGVPGAWAPLLHLRRLGNGGIFDRFAQHFDNVWATSIPWEPPA